MASNLPPPNPEAPPYDTDDRVCRPQEQPQTPLSRANDQSGPLLQPGRRRASDVQRHALLHDRHLLFHSLAYHLHGRLWNRRRSQINQTQV